MTSEHCHASRESALVVSRPVEEAFALFTPLGEKSWAEDWAPEFVWPLSGESAEGMVFTTQFRGHETVWVLTRLDLELHHVEYVRLTPGWFIATVSVTCRSSGPGTTSAQVRYDYTALSVDGHRLLESYTQEEHEQMIAEWEREIRRYLGAR